MSDDPRLNLPSASSFERIVQCPGSAALIASLPPNKEEAPDEIAARGTRIHEARRTGNTLSLEEDEAEDYRLGLKHERALAYQTFGEEPDVKEFSWLPRLWLSDPQTCEPCLSGETDVLYIKPPLAAVLDWKTGWNNWLTPSQRNWQLRVYAVLVWKEFDGLERIRVGLIKPKAKIDPVDFVDYSTEDLRQSEQAIFFHLWRARQPDAPRTPGAHCRYCPARAFCKEAAAYSLLPSVINTNGDLLAAVQQLSGPDLVKLFETETVVTKIFEAVKTRLKAMPDWQLGELGLERGKPMRLDPIFDTEGVWKFLVATGAELKDLWPALQWSKGKLADMLRATRGFSEEGAQQYIREALAEFIEKKDAEAPLKKKTV